MVQYGRMSYRDYINANDFGAWGRDSTNDQPSLQNAIDWMESNTGGGILYLPAGRYVITAPLILKNNIKLCGAGPGVTTIVADLAIAAIKGQFTTYSTSASGQNHEVDVSSLTIDGLTKRAGGIALDLLQIESGLFNDLEIVNFDIALRMSGGCSKHTFIQVSASNITNAAVIRNGASQIRFVGCNFASSTGNMVVVAEGANAGVSDVEFYSCVLEETGGSIVYDLQDCSTFTIENVNVIGGTIRNAVARTPVRFGAGVSHSSGMMVQQSGVTSPVYVGPDNLWGTSYRPVSGGQVSVYDFGAVGDGVADDTSAISAAITAVSQMGGGTLLFPSGTYRCTSQLTVPSGVSLIGSGSRSSTITFAGASAVAFPNQACIYSSGSIEALPSLGVSVVQGDYSITLGSAPNLANGDAFSIWNSTNSSFNPARTYYRAGEWKIVRGVSGAVVTVDRGAYEGYTAGPSIQVNKLVATTVEMCGLEIVGIGTTSTVCVVKVDYGRDLVFRDLAMTGSQNACLAIYRSVGCTCDNLAIEDYGAAVGLNYGIVLASTYRTVITNSRIGTTRHAVTHGQFDGVSGVPMRLSIVDGCNLASSAFNAYDVHGGGEYYQVSNCEMIGGANLGGDHGRVSDCHMTSMVPNGQIMILSETIGLDFSISDCTFEETVLGTDNVVVDWSGYTTTSTNLRRAGGTLRFIDCEFRLGSTQYPMIIYNRSTSILDVSVEISGCRLYRPSRAPTFPMAYIRAAVGSAFRNVTIRNTESDGVCFWIDAPVQTFFVSGCDIKSVPLYGVKFLRTGLAADFPWGAANGRQILKATDNVIRDCNLTGITLEGWNIATTISQVTDNVFLRNGQVPSGSSSYDAAGYFVNNAIHAKITGNTLGDDGSPTAASRLCAQTNISTLEEHDNLRIGTVTAVNESGIGQRISQIRRVIGGRVNYESVATAAPATGTWSLGDLVWNGNPAVGQPIGWICTVAGTPGTWVAMANL